MWLKSMKKTTKITDLKYLNILETFPDGKPGYYRYISDILHKSNS